MNTGDSGRRLLTRALPFLWLGLSIVWATVIIVTDHVAGPLALWIATTVGPLTALQHRPGSRSTRPA